MDVVEFTIFELDFPRSISFSINRMGVAMDTIGLEGKENTAAAFTELKDTVKVQTGEAVFTSGLHEFLERLLASLASFHTALAEDFFK